VSTPPVTTIVITDTNVLINFLHIGQLPLLGELPTYKVQLPTEVLQEIPTPSRERRSTTRSLHANSIYWSSTHWMPSPCSATCAI